MKNSVISKVIIICILVVCLCSGFNNNEEYLREKAIVAAMDEIRSFSERDEGSQWDDSTTISSIIELYDPNNSINGYIFDLSTEGHRSGFIQVGIADGACYIVNIGFIGDNYAVEQLDQYNRDKKDGDIYPVSYLYKNKVYYLGGFNYLVEKGNDYYIDLGSGSIEKIDKITLENAYNDYKRAISQDYKGDITTLSSSKATTTTKIVSSFGTANTHMVYTQYFSGYHDHCSPTAATNMVIYCKYGRGYFGSDTSNVTTIFQRFYNKMETNCGTDPGTYHSKLYPAYKWYVQTYGGSALIAHYSTSVLISTIKTKINGNIPLQLEVDDLINANECHSVNVWGYSTTNSTNYLSITKNISNRNTSLINFSAYSYAQFTYWGIS